MKKIIKYGLLLGAGLFLSGCSSESSSTKPFNSTKHYTQELKAVRKEKYKKGKMLNHSEMKLLLALEEALRGKDYRIVLQTSLGAFLNHKEKKAFLAVNCKRADFVIMNRFAYPEAVIEYNGEGHYQNNSSLRDDIKSLSCQSADLPFIQISFHDKNNFEEVIKEKVLPVLYKAKS